MRKLKRLRPHGTLILEVDGSKVVDEDLARLLLLIDRGGSILSASRILKIAYSRAWESIARAERILGVRLVEPRRGGRSGGGAKLTAAGRKLLELYLEEYRRLLGRRLAVEEARIEAPELVYAGSNDLLLEHIFGLMKSEGIESIEVAWIGSAGGLSLLMLGEADLAGIHLYDPETGEYNAPYISRYWLENRVVLVRGYERELGFASRKAFEDPIEAIVSGRAKLVNRNLGSGTRVRLDCLLKERSVELGKPFSELIRGIRGYGEEVKTHLDVVRAIASGRADIGLTIRWMAEKYGLNFKPIGWEKFDFVIPVESLKRKPVKVFLKALASEELRGLVEGLSGYRVSKDSGRVIYG